MRWKTDEIAELADPVVRAEKVWILSGETSQAGAHALHSGLSMVRPGVRALEEHSFGTDLSDAGPKRRSRRIRLFPLPAPGRYRRPCFRGRRRRHRCIYRQPAFSAGGVGGYLVSDRSTGDRPV